MQTDERLVQFSKAYEATLVRFVPSVTDSSPTQLRKALSFAVVRVGGSVTRSSIGTLPNAP